MPGGGMGGIAQALLGGGHGGGGGMGGPGGGMGGMENPGGRQSNQEGQPQDIYDVDRWARADGLDLTGPTMVQQVRADWERKDKEKKHRIRNFLSREKRSDKDGKVRKKRKKKAEAEPEPEARPTGGTVVMPDMKRAQTRALSKDEEKPPTPPPPVQTIPQDACRMCNPNYLGLTFRSSLDDFFKSDPLNSAILAVDTLSMSDLTFSQVLPPVQDTHRCHRVLHQMERAQQLAQMQQKKETADALSTAPVVVREPPAQPSATPYMDAFHESREERKYNVRVT